MKKRRVPKFLTSLLTIGIISGILGGLLTMPMVLQKSFESWHLKISDIFYSTQNRAWKDIVIIGIDDKSLSDTSKGGLGRWQDWSRAYYAKVIDNVSADNARAIGIDVFFSERSNQSLRKKIQTSFPNLSPKQLDTFIDQDDIALKEALAQHTDTVVLAAKQSTHDDKEEIIPHSFFLTDSTRIASVYTPEDTNNSIREIPLKIESKLITDSFAVGIVKAYLGLEATTGKLDPQKYSVSTTPTRIGDTKIAPIVIPTAEGDHMLINFFGRPYSYKTLSFVDVYHGNFPKDTFRDKIVLIGEVGTGLHDVSIVPTSFGLPMPGVEIHANTIQTILSGKFLYNQSTLSIILIMFLSCILIGIISSYIKISLSWLPLIIFMVGYLVSGILLFSYHGIILQMTYTPLAVLLTYFISLLIKQLVVERQKAYITRAFSRYVPDSVVQKIVDDPDKLNLGGEKKNLTIFFSDIAGFTSIAEKLSAETLVSILNTYLHEMTSILQRYDATIDKYIGDAIMCFWGAPLDVTNQAKKACLAALECQKKLGELREMWLKEGYPELSVRIGLNTGNVVVGNIGSQSRFDYTVIGDDVNLASRLEGINKEYGTSIIISEETKHMLGDDTEMFVLRELDLVAVKGKAKPVTIYELICKKEDATPKHLELIEKFMAARSLYLKGEFEKASKSFQALTKEYPNDAASHTYHERSEYFLAHSPTSPWDGVWAMKTK